jgi:vacuolar-type H+-ATPase subunit H
MRGQIEETLKALTEFEQELDRAKVDASEAKRRMIKNASDWSESAKQSALNAARNIAEKQVSRARTEAEAQAARIREDGLISLKTFEGSLARNKGDAVELVMRTLLGEAK